MKFRKVNNITGWIVFAIAYFTYLKTMEATVSFWDCGEFLSCAYRLEVGHSPGAPLFMMLGRIFSLFAPSKQLVAIFVNSLSALMSGLTILFLFWTITHFAKRLIAQSEEALSAKSLIAILGAGIVGALAYAYSDTFWFSAVEAEVYASSSFFTAFVFWAVLKWEDNADSPHADRWLLLIFYMVGLSIGVHLLSLLTIPAVVMVYYFKKYTPSVRGGIIAFIVGCLILGFIQFGVIQYIPIIASKFELLFVNSFGLPFSSGALFFLLLIAVLMAWLLIWSRKKGKYFLHLGSLCLVFIFIGCYSSYVTYIIRSKADVPIDMGNPDNVMTLIPYLQRAQYGSTPLIYGPDFDSRVTAIDDDGPVYAAVQKDGKDHYELVDHKSTYEYDKERFFPRIWDFNDPNHINFYRSYLGLDKTEAPTGLDNQKFFWGYQMDWMYWRYFLWNYVGRENDFEGQGEANDGNWISGIKPVDRFFGRGDIDKLPVFYRTTPSRNQLYFLPFIIGILGLVYQSKKDKKNTIVVGLFFFFTGIAIVLYLNNTPLQPRERDYAYVSTYAFAIWIGLGVLSITHWLQKYLKGTSSAIAASLICLMAAPVLMASQEWDDHDRSQKTLARDHAFNMLSTCDSNAILITSGDNDTYPLWYLQEVEGYRTDVRIINVNLLGTDWQNDQLTFKVNDADAIPVIWKPEQYRGGKLNYIPYYAPPNVPSDKYFNIYDVIHFFSSGKNQVTNSSGDKMNFLPTKNIFIPLDKAAILKSGIVPLKDSGRIPAQINFVFNNNNATRGALALMNIIAGQAQTGWTRPIYFAGGVDKIGLDAYFQKEGILDKFVPETAEPAVGGIEPYADLDKTLNMFLHQYTFGKADGNKVYYDEKNRLIFLVYRQNAAELAMTLVEKGRKADAVKVLDHFLKSVSEHSLGYDILMYDHSMLFMLKAYYAAGAMDKAHYYGNKMLRNIRDEIKYFNSLKTSDQSGWNAATAEQNLNGLNFMVQSAQQAGDTATAKKWQQTFQAIIPPALARPAMQGQ
jgi:hypothetical protein